MTRLGSLAALLLITTAPLAYAQDIDALKAQLGELVDGKAKLTQEIVDSVFSFAEVGFHETETMRYLTEMLEAEGFEIETGIGGMPTAWVATWSNGEGPAISFNSDVDGLPGQSQKPGVLTRQPLVDGGDGHGEGHNTGIAVSVVGALATKELMESEGITGTLQIWPGIAEEALAAKQWFVKAGILDDIDVVISNHVGNGLSTSWGQSNSMSMISAEFSFTGVSAHGAVSPWSGRSALDAVELMNAGWNFRREHLHPDQRSHYVISNGGLQPNIVPDNASVWYYFRNTSPDAAVEMLEIADGIAEGATLMTGTSYERRILGSAWPSHGNEALAKAMYENIKSVGMPEWSEDDQAYAKAVQEAIGAATIGLRTEIGDLAGPVEKVGSGPSDDIGAVMWTKPTVRLSYPANIAGTITHNWQAALAVATPIAHKGALAGAKVTALTALDILTDPELVEAAETYFTDVQTKDLKYYPFESETDVPSTHLNAETDARNRPRQAEFYYDPSQHETYLDQLGIDYPQLEVPAPATN
ncbi:MULTISPECIES: amidohydrolase [unclassified Devosia]|uniref:amidohydrolase n=1 Tax=unclassified Devosia TaxID=196773 RepID=UPI00155475DF|nr:MULTISPECIES: amidohydrolase [unclassified Devosia]